MALQPGIYKVYNIVSDGTNLRYSAIARFQIDANQNLAILEDGTGELARYCPPGPVEQHERFLKSFVNGSYRHTVLEQPGQVYPPTFTHAF